jgi:hypothetical protein
MDNNKVMKMLFADGESSAMTERERERERERIKMT